MQQKSNLVLVTTSHNKKHLLKSIISNKSSTGVFSIYPSTPAGKNQQKLSNPLNPVLKTKICHPVKVTGNPTQAVV
jgi:hypothetical protein